jgi:hypothetical protein
MANRDDIEPFLEIVIIKAQGLGCFVKAALPGNPSRSIP